MKHESRREEILGAALVCCQRYGRAKTTMSDVARLAGVSRPLVYTHFKNRSELLLCLSGELIEKERLFADKVIRSESGGPDKLFKILALYGISRGCLPGADSNVAARYQAMLIKALARLIGRRDLAEVLFFSARGLQWDKPSVPILFKRFRLLAELGWRLRVCGGRQSSGADLEVQHG
jgi:AcrR family transcriptional regulator